MTSAVNFTNHCCAYGSGEVWLEVCRQGVWRAVRGCDLRGSNDWSCLGSGVRGMRLVVDAWGGREVRSTIFRWCVIDCSEGTGDLCRKKLIKIHINIELKSTYGINTS